MGDFYLRVCLYYHLSFIRDVYIRGAPMSSCASATAERSGAATIYTYICIVQDNIIYKTTTNRGRRKDSSDYITCRRFSSDLRSATQSGAQTFHQYQG